MIICKIKKYNREAESMDTGPFVLVGIIVLAVLLVVGIVRLGKNN